MPDPGHDGEPDGALKNPTNAARGVYGIPAFI